jgi:hypothetical protein
MVLRLQNIKRGTEKAEMKIREGKFMSMNSRDNSLTFRDHGHFFFLDERVFFFLNSSENVNETGYKKLTVMENLHVTMITKKKEIISLILILLGRRKKI